MDKIKLSEILKILLEHGQKFDYKACSIDLEGYIRDFPSGWRSWEQRAYKTVTDRFAPDSAPYVVILSARNEAYQAIQTKYGYKFNNAMQRYKESIQEALSVVENDLYGELLSLSSQLPETIDSRKVFVVHGRDHTAKTELELFLKEIELDPIVLHREVDEGLTLIEKFEKHSNVAYALVLLTPDDIVSLQEAITDKEFKEVRARQNVIFELGFFLGKLSRNRVCCIAKRGVVFPSDIQGLVYKPYLESIGEVKYELIKELRKAGYSV